MRTVLGTIRFISIAMLVLLLTACGPRMVELSQPPERLNQYGYSFMPLNEAGWKVAGRDGQKVVLGRAGSSRDETVIIMAGHLRSPRFASTSDFRGWVEERATEGGERYSPQKQELTTLQHGGTDCVRLYIVTIDHQAVTRSGKGGDMILELMQLFCRHPDNERTITMLSYSQRAYAGFQDPKFIEKAQRLLESLEFSDF